jgi:hypothetical protein
LLRVAIGVPGERSHCAISGITLVSFSAPSFHQADRQTYRRVALVGVLFCAAFVLISFSLRPQSEESRVLVKADRLVRTAGQAPQAH